VSLDEGSYGAVVQGCELELEEPSVVAPSFAAFLATADFSRDLASLSAPTLIVWGERDAYALQTDQQTLLAAIPGARLITYEGHGHAMHWEDPVRFAEDVSRFVFDGRR